MMLVRFVLFTLNCPSFLWTSLNSPSFLWTSFLVVLDLLRSLRTQKYKATAMANARNNPAPTAEPMMIEVWDFLRGLKGNLQAPKARPQSPVLLAKLETLKDFWIKEWTSPDKRLLETLKFFSLARLLSCSGIWPFNRLFWRLRILRYKQFPMSDGISPENSLEDRSRIVI